MYQRVNNSMFLDTNTSSCRPFLHTILEVQDTCESKAIVVDWDLFIKVFTTLNLNFFFTHN